MASNHHQSHFFKRLSASVAALLLNFAALAQPPNTGDLPPPQSIVKGIAAYPLSPETEDSLRQVAATSDCLILGEMHGTQEVPALVVGLLAPLSRLGYQTLALELPIEQKNAVLAFARGETDVVPPFFAAPSGDGRGNIQLLSLIRIAVSAPFQWHLICFDAPPDLLLNSPPLSNPPSQTDWTALAVKRDATMASILCDQYQQQDAKSKVLALCGNLHARTANHASAASMRAMLWPSFARSLKDRNLNWKLSAVNIIPHRGGYFNGGKVNQLNGQVIDQTAFKHLKDDDWDFQLDIPTATAATFLKMPPHGTITDR